MHAKVLFLCTRLMEKYKNLSGNSGIYSYEIGAEYIKVRFDKGTYLYDYKMPGKTHVDQMKKLAIKGRGLATYINIHVRENFSLRIE